MPPGAALKKPADWMFAFISFGGKQRFLLCAFEAFGTKPPLRKHKQQIGFVCLRGFRYQAVALQAQAVPINSIGAQGFGRQVNVLADGCAILRDCQVNVLADGYVILRDRCCWATLPCECVSGWVRDSMRPVLLGETAM